LDPNGQVSVDGFFNLGQIVGGFDGLQYIIKGCTITETQLQERPAQDRPHWLKKIVQGLFAQIEIWMTDLCMEPQAETQCQDLIAKAIELDPSNPETWTLLASIRISQQQPQEAQEHIRKSWELFQVKKQGLEDSADTAASDNNNNNDNNDGDVNLEYIEMIQPLLTLAKYATEVGLFDVAATVAANIHDITDDLLEPFYVEAFSNYLAAKTLEYQLKNPNAVDEGDGSRLEAINNVKLSMDSEGNGATEEITEYINSALVALSNGSRIMYASSDSEDELREQIGFLVEELGGKAALKRVEKLNKNEGATINEDNWEDEIQE